MTPITARELIRLQASRAHDLLESLTCLYLATTNDHDFDALDDLDRLARAARIIANTLNLIHNTLSPPAPKRAADQCDSPGQIPLFQHTPTDSH